MPSFLSKVFGSSSKHKKSPTDSSSNSQLLGGKFEAVSPTVSPSAEKFSSNAAKIKDKENGKEKDKDGGAFSTIFRSKSRPHLPASSSGSLSTKVEDAPHLSLRLDTDAGARSNVKDVFTEEALLSESAILERRLSPEEVTALVRACKGAIIARGLETLGVMHPHWYSASPELQRRLISLFLRSLSSSSTSPASATATFESELEETRDPHDVAAVLRWGLRHLQLSPTSSSVSNSKLESEFGKTKDWYPSFSSAEAAQNYPTNAYTSILAPLVPEANLALLGEVLEVVSALAPLAEQNSTSAARLSMIFGIWLLVEDPRIRKAEGWKEFYERWEGMGRVLEHLFLARVRDESLKNRLPTRLLDLVRSYPYGANPSSDGLLPRTRFSTLRHPALFVHVETEVTTRYKETQGKKRLGPRVLVSRALAAQVIPSGEGEGEDNERALWTVLRECKKTEDGDEVDLGSMFADETLRLFELVEKPRGRRGRDGQPLSPTFSIFPPASPIRSPILRSQSERETITSTSPSSNGHAKSATDSLLQTPTMSPTTAASSIVMDWAQFSSAGFGDVSAQRRLAETLWDEEVEKTAPRVQQSDSVVGRIRSRSRSRSRTRAKKSGDIPRDGREEMEAEKEEAEKFKSRVVQVSSVLIDEAFVDFWSDALTDSVVTREWPEFVVCKLKSTLSPPNQGETENKKKVEYLVLEHSYTVPPPPPPPPVEPTPRASSPRPSLKDKKRFSFFSSSTSGRPSIGGRGQSGSVSSVKNRFGSGKTKVGEMGEVLKEEEEKATTTVKVKVPVPKGRKSLAKEDEAKEEAVAKKEGEKADKNDEAETAKVLVGAVAGAAVGAVVADAVVSGVTEAASAPTAEDKQAEIDPTPKAEGAPAPTSAEADTTPKAEVPAPEAAPSPIEEATPEAAPAPIEEATPEAAPAASEVVGTIPAEEPVPAPILVLQPDGTTTVAPEPAAQKSEEPVVEEAVVELPTLVEKPATPTPSSQEATEQPVEALEAESVPSDVFPVNTEETTPAPVEPTVANEPALDSTFVVEPSVPKPVVDKTEEPTSADAPADPVDEQPAPDPVPPSDPVVNASSVQQPSELPEQETPAIDVIPVEDEVTQETATSDLESTVEKPATTETPIIGTKDEAPTVGDETAATTEPILEKAEGAAAEDFVVEQPVTEAASEKPDEPLPVEPVAFEHPSLEEATTTEKEPAPVVEEPTVVVEEFTAAAEFAATNALATEPEATDDPAPNVAQDTGSSANPNVVAVVDVTPPTNDSSAPVSIEVVRPSPTPSDAGVERTETTARAAGPEPVVEHVLLAEDAKEEPVDPTPELEAAVESPDIANGTSDIPPEPKDENTGGATADAPVEEDPTEMLSKVAVENDDSSDLNGQAEPEVAATSTDGLPAIEELKTSDDINTSQASAEVEEAAAEAPSHNVIELPALGKDSNEVEEPATEPTNTTDNVISAVPRVEPLPTDVEDTAEDKLVDLPAVPIVEAPVPSNPPEDAFVSVTVTEPEIRASTEVADSSPAASEEDSAILEVAASKEDELPTAPESVVLAGSTPGPALALSTGEPAGAGAATEDDAVVESSEASSKQANGKHVEEPSDVAATSTETPPNGSSVEPVHQEAADKD